MIGAQVMPEPEAEKGEQADADDGVCTVKILFDHVQIAAHFDADPGEEVAPGNRPRKRKE